MKINWNPNPLRTTIDLDDRDRQMILLYIQAEEYSDVLCSLDNWLERKTKKDDEPTLEKVHEKIQVWREIYNMKLDHEEVKAYEDYLQMGHGGDCVCWAVSCVKCRAEAALGLDTVRGLGPHEAAAVMGAFGKGQDKTIDDAIETLKTPIDATKRDPVWNKYPLEEYTKNIPRWEAERVRALKWLEKYKEEHEF